jgi:DNA topoisomerase-2
VSELVFGHLLTGSNYDDSVKKVTGGRNGFGAKLTNIFSKKFVVENGDSKKGKKFKMTWTQNMSKKSDPEISDFDENDFTCVTFEPDFKRFGMAELSDDEISLMKKRVYDMAGVLPSHVKVYLNGKKLPITNF